MNDALRCELEAALATLAHPAPDSDGPRTEAVDGVPGAFVARGVLAPAECERLTALVARIHAAHPIDRSVIAARRGSQHHLAGRLAPEALAPLRERLRPVLPATAGPTSPCPILHGPEALSGFMRTYYYAPGALSAPHYDRSQRECDPDGTLRRFSAYTVVVYLNDEFEGGHTTFFEADQSLLRSAKGNTPLVAGRHQLTVATSVAPRGGDVLIFPHGLASGCHPDPLHEGSVVQGGSKAILRTDLVFEMRQGPARAPAAGGELGSSMAPGLDSAAREAAETRLQAAIAAVLGPQIGSDLAGVPGLTVAACKRRGAAEMRSDAAAAAFWHVFKAQGRPADRTIAVAGPARAGLGEFAVLVARELAADPWFAHVVLDDSAHSKPRILLVSAAYAETQAERGLVVCPRCGKTIAPPQHDDVDAAGGAPAEVPDHTCAGQAISADAIATQLEGLRLQT
mmetsp:Transcript_18324/g.52658  ORF Transcript_18324/g.52658 Transcript_18324/m.52658 type:complete len:455 (-) Transcript_18324:800-2164(-)